MTAQRYRAAAQQRRFPVDEKIRAHGWEIWARPEKGEPLWRKRGEVVGEGEVLARIADEAKGKIR